MSEEILIYLSPIGIIFVFFIKEYFASQREKARKKNGEDLVTRVAVMEEKLNNHCQHLDKEMTLIREDIKTITNEVIDIRLKMK